MKSVVMHLYSGINVNSKDHHVELLYSDESAEVHIFKDKIVIVKGTVQQFIEMLFKYFFLTEYAKNVRNTYSVNDSFNTKITVYENIVLDLKRYTAECRCTPPEWWDEFQDKLVKYKNLLIFM